MTWRTEGRAQHSIEAVLGTFLREPVLTCLMDFQGFDGLDLIWNWLKLNGWSSEPSPRAVFSDLLTNETSWGNTVTIYRNGIKIIEYPKIMQNYTIKKPHPAGVHHTQAKNPDWVRCVGATIQAALKKSKCGGSAHPSSSHRPCGTRHQGEPGTREKPGTRGTRHQGEPGIPHQQSEFRTGGAGGSGRATSTHTGATGNGWQLIWYAPCFHVRNKPGEWRTLKEAHLF